MKFEKKEPEIRIQPFNAYKNPWDRCTCTICAIPHTIEHSRFIDDKGNMTLAWHGQSITGGHLWQCAKCTYEDKVKFGVIE